MIVGIVAIPNRYNSSWILGDLTSPMYKFSGRPVKVAPLNFYKVFSSYGNSHYEHIFASDSILDTTTLAVAKNRQTMETDRYYGGTLVPISVKMVCEGVSVTYLFVRSIHYLLSTYSSSRPIDADLECIHRNGVCSTELTDEYIGVVSADEYASRIYQPIHICANSTDWLIWTSISPEQPDLMSSFYGDLHYYDATSGSWNGSENMENQWGRDRDNERQTVMQEMRTELSNRGYAFYPRDPISILCMASPSYIYGFQLAPHLPDPMTTRSFNSVVELDARLPDLGGCIAESETRTGEEKNDAYTLPEKFMDYLIDCPDTSFQLIVDRNRYSVSAHNLFNTGTSDFLHLAELVRDSFPYKNVELVKSPLDEYVIHGTGPLVPGTRDLHVYLHMGWYHLTSPSLPNSSVS